MSELHLKLKKVEDPRSGLVSKRLKEPDRADQFKLVVTDGNGGFVTCRADRDKWRKELIKCIHQLDRS